MPTQEKTSDILDREFLNIRCRLIEIASSLDRIDRGDSAEAIQSDPRMTQLHQAVGILNDERPDRAERVQLVFSDPYDENWRAKK